MEGGRRLGCAIQVCLVHLMTCTPSCCSLAESPVLGSQDRPLPLLAPPIPVLHPLKTPTSSFALFTTGSFTCEPHLLRLSWAWGPTVANGVAIWAAVHAPSHLC